jgi:3-isopropylmalate/(R)-2-methylmalate dehydratase large subunit
MEPLKVRRIEVRGRLGAGVYAKDVILEIIRRLGVKGGAGYAYEYAGDAVERMSMDERMTICNMSIEGGARVGYVNPDETTFAFLRGRPVRPAGGRFERATAWWASMASDAKRVLRRRDGAEGGGDRPTVTVGHQPGQSVGVDEALPANADPEALAFMDFRAGQRIQGTKIDVAFVGSCTKCAALRPA